MELTISHLQAGAFAAELDPQPQKFILIVKILGLFKNLQIIHNNN